jgi:hypothetical protein
MMKKVYDAIARVSEALGLGPQFITLALMNVRNLIMDVGGIFGKKYDLTQLEWLSTLNRYLQIFGSKMEEYRNNPEALLFDLGELIERPAQDSKGSFQQGFIQSLEQVVGWADKVGTAFVTIGIDLDKLHDDLPAFIKDQIPDPGGIFDTRLGTWVTDVFNPAVNELQGVVNEWVEEAAAQKVRMSSIVEELKKPGTLAAGIDELPSILQDGEENLLYTYSSRTVQRIATDFAPIGSWAIEDLEKIGRVPIPPVTPSLVLSYEPMGLHPVGLGAPAQRAAWSVGDY